MPTVRYASQGVGPTTLGCHEAVEGRGPYRRVEHLRTAAADVGAPWGGVVVIVLDEPHEVVADVIMEPVMLDNTELSTNERNTTTFNVTPLKRYCTSAAIIRIHTPKSPSRSRNVCDAIEFSIAITNFGSEGFE